MSIRHVDFGRDVAEFDTHLADFFVETPAYEAVRAGKKAVVIGRKGTGKTALSRYAVETENPSFEYVLPIEATHSTYVKIDEHLRSFTSQIKNIDSSFKLAWLFTTLMALVDRLTREQAILVTPEERELHEFAKQNLSYQQADPISAIAGYAAHWIKNLKKVGPIERGLDASGEVVFDEVRLLELIRAAVSRINDKDREVTLFYDRLDDRWDGSELYRAFLQGLLLAVKDLKALGLRLVPVVLLRDDIFSEVVRDFQHIDHFRMEIQRIEWDERSLVELIGLRIKSSLRRRGDQVDDLTAEELWEKAFTPDLPAKRQPIPTTAYMVERTLFRPRDIILFATYAKEKATGARIDIIDADAIHAAEEQYSKDKLRDLVAEHSYRLPGLDRVLEKFRYAKIGFNLDDLRFLILQIKEDLEHQLVWLKQHEDELIKLLYRIGFVSFTTRGGVLRGTRVVHSGVNPDEKIILEQKRVYVSPIFREALDMKGT